MCHMSFVHWLGPASILCGNYITFAVVKVEQSALNYFKMLVNPCPTIKWLSTTQAKHKLRNTLQ